jgi:hypothetical protein
LRFRLYPLRFTLRARDAICFPPGKSANILRGGFGLMLQRLGDAYPRIFEPRASRGPSGLADLPRPFVFRAAHLDGKTIAPGELFHFGLNYFAVRDPAAIGHIADAFAELGREGLGPGRGRAELHAFVPPSAPLVLSLEVPAEPGARVRVEFVTPTEIKGTDRPEFGMLAARIRDRLSTLREFYDDGPLPIDFHAFGERARQVRMVRCETGAVTRSRRSSRTGQSHPIGGFTGEAEYEGDLAEFIPYLQAAAWTGVGRQTVWGKGEIRTAVLEST